MSHHHRLRAMTNMNVFRILGDVFHTASKCILIWAILRNKSAEGMNQSPFWFPIITQQSGIYCFVALWGEKKANLLRIFHSFRLRQTGISLITQVLYAAVFCTRYLDLFWATLATDTDKWNFVLKIFYILSSFYIIYLMMQVYARTRERERAWKLGAIALGGAMFAAPFVTLIIRGTTKHFIVEVRGSDCPVRGWLVCSVRLC